MKWLSILILGLTLLFAPGFGAQVEGIDLDKLNRLVEETNFIVDSVCSGTLISAPRKLVLTNFHCIEGKVTKVEREELQADGTLKKTAREIRGTVTLGQKQYKDGVLVGNTVVEAEILAHERKKDLALLQIIAEIPQRQASEMLPAGQRLTRGQRVYIVGNPAGLDATIVEGIVSNVNRTIEWEPDVKIQYFQFSGGVFGGNSGGAVYDDAGYLIGVPAAGHRWATFLGFAIPASTVRAWMDTLALPAP